MQIHKQFTTTINYGSLFELAVRDHFSFMPSRGMGKLYIEFQISFEIDKTLVPQKHRLKSCKQIEASLYQISSGNNIQPNNYEIHAILPKITAVSISSIGNKIQTLESFVSLKEYYGRFLDRWRHVSSRQFNQNGRNFVFGRVENNMFSSLGAH